MWYEDLYATRSPWGIVLRRRECGSAVWNFDNTLHLAFWGRRL